MDYSLGFRVKWSFCMVYAGNHQTSGDLTYGQFALLTNSLAS